MQVFVDERLAVLCVVKRDDTDPVDAGIGPEDQIVHPVDSDAIRRHHIFRGDLFFAVFGVLKHWHQTRPVRQVLDLTSVKLITIVMQCFNKGSLEDFLLCNIRPHNGALANVIVERDGAAQIAHNRLIGACAQVDLANVFSVGK